MKLELFLGSSEEMSIEKQKKDDTTESGSVGAVLPTQPDSANV